MFFSLVAFVSAVSGVSVLASAMEPWYERVWMGSAALFFGFAGMAFARAILGRWAYARTNEKAGGSMNAARRCQLTLTGRLRWVVVTFYLAIVWVVLQIWHVWISFGPLQTVPVHVPLAGWFLLMGVLAQFANVRTKRVEVSGTPDAEDHERSGAGADVPVQQ